MFKTLLNIFRIPELRNKVLFTLFLLAIYRIGFSVPLPGVDQEMLRAAIEQQEQSNNDPARRFAQYVSIFSGGNINQSTIFGLGVMPYISASIIMQLLATVVPALEKIKKEGQTGYRKINEWTRYLTLPLALVQGVFWLGYIQSRNEIDLGFLQLHGLAWWVLCLTILVSASMFLMWLGEQIDEYGLGNGVSLLIMAGILSQLPAALGIVIDQYIAGSQQAGSGATNSGKVVFLILSFVLVTMFAIYITQAQRRITIQQAKFTRGRKVYGGQKQFLPLRLNHGGVMPVIFAQSLMILPTFLVGYLLNWFGVGPAGIFSFLNDQVQPGHYVYVLLEIILIYFFAYFWTTVQFQPKEMATQLRDYGSFVPGIRPGKRTADYLQSVMYHITFVGAAFLCTIAVIPAILAKEMGINPLVASFLGGTGLLIVISVALDLVQRIEANLLMRNYGGFLGGEGGTGRAGIRGSRR